MKARFVESQPARHKREAQYSDQIVTILRRDPADGMFLCRTDSKDRFWAEPYELTEHSQAFKLFILKQRILGL